MVVSRQIISALCARNLLGPIFWGKGSGLGKQVSKKTFLAYGGSPDTKWERIRVPIHTGEINSTIQTGFTIELEDRKLLGSYSSPHSYKNGDKREKHHKQPTEKGTQPPTTHIKTMTRKMTMHTDSTVIPQRSYLRVKSTITRPTMSLASKTKWKPNSEALSWRNDL